MGPSCAPGIPHRRHEDHDRPGHRPRRCIPIQRHPHHRGDPAGHRRIAVDLDSARLIERCAMRKGRHDPPGERRVDELDAKRPVRPVQRGDRASPGIRKDLPLARTDGVGADRRAVGPGPAPGLPEDSKPPDPGIVGGAVPVEYRPVQAAARFSPPPLLNRMSLTMPGAPLATASFAAALKTSSS